MRGTTLAGTESLKRPYALRRVPSSDIAAVFPPPESPTVGDILLTRLEKVGKNTRIELTDGRVANLYEGDRLAVVLGHRYATEQFEGYAGVQGDTCDLLSMGGVCGVLESRHAAVPDPTRLRVLGALGNRDGEPLRLSSYSLEPTKGGRRPKVAVVCGSSMDSGKTVTARSLIRGLSRAGRSVVGIKLTGTACGRDTWSMLDAGARSVFDFVDGGLPSTYRCTTDRLESLHHTLLEHAAVDRAEWVVMEVADGVLQRETQSLLRCAAFVSSVDAWLYATGDALGAVGGIATLRSRGIEPIAISGLISMSPLAMKEAQLATGIRCVTSLDLQYGRMNDVLIPAPPIRIDLPLHRVPDAVAGVRKS